MSDALTRWKVEITSTTSNERLLRDVLDELSVEVISLNGQCVLASSRFESCSTAGEVDAIASELKSLVDEVGKHDAQLASQLRVDIGSVLERRSDGTWARHHVLKAALTGVFAIGGVGTLTVTRSPPLSEDEQRQIEAERLEDEYQQLRRKAVSRIVSASRDERALKVQRLLAGELTPLDMGHIVELIEADPDVKIGEIVSKRQLSRLTGSINHPAVYSENARHSVATQQPPPNPMTEGEARPFVRSLATRWMERKAGI
jgi:hypothetical protein